MPLVATDAGQITRMDARSLAAFRQLELLAHTVVEGMVTGLHTSPFKGFAIEFDEHRPYVAGDDLKHLDWKILARKDRMYIKQYEEDTSMRAHFVLDTSGSMGYRSATYSKLDLGRVIVGTMSYLLLNQMDAVGLTTCAEKTDIHLPPRSTRTHYKRLMDTMETLRPREGTHLADTLHELALRIKRRALVVIISDCFDDPDRIRLALNHFAHRRHEVILFHVLDRRELTFEFDGPTRFDDLEAEGHRELDPRPLRKAYLKAFEAHRDILRRTCHERRIDYELVLTDEPIERRLARYLVERMKRS